MSSRKYVCIFLFFAMVVPFSAKAITITSTEFSTYGLPSDYYTEYSTGSPAFIVTETYSSAAERGMSTALYEYTIENLSTDFNIVFFRILNPEYDMVSDYTETGTMSSPAGWSPRAGIPTFVWDMNSSYPSLTDAIKPGDTLSGFAIETDKLLEPDLGRNASFVSGAQHAFQTFGLLIAFDSSDQLYSFAATSTAVPEPGTVFLMILGGLALCLHSRKTMKKRGNSVSDHMVRSYF